MTGSHERRSAAVCVPIRNEVALLPCLLDALVAQRGVENIALCLLFDSCDDGSAQVVTARAKTLPFSIFSAEVQTGAPNAGLARRRAMALGLSMLRDDDAMIISTDADSVPDSDWLANNLAALDVADVVAGRIVRTDGNPSPAQDRIESYYDSLFALRRAIDPVPWEAARTHHYVSGASLAFRASAYRALGGFEPLASREDARLVDAAHNMGLRVRRDSAIRVETSPRRQGRATGGLADHLRRLDKGNVETTMAHPEDAAWQYERHALARAARLDLFADRLALVKALGCTMEHVDDIASQALNAEAFAMRVVPEVPAGERIVTLDEAETALSRLWDSRRALAA